MVFIASFYCSQATLLAFTVCGVFKESRFLNLKCFNVWLCDAQPNFFLLLLKWTESPERLTEPFPGCSSLFLQETLGKSESLISLISNMLCWSFHQCNFNLFSTFSLCIVNDELFIRNATTEEIRRAFVAPAPTPSSSPVPTLSAHQQEMLAAFSQKSEMNLEWSQK